MIFGTHFLLYSRDAEADRAFFRDALGFRDIDVGGGWLVFQMPPAEAAIHPSDQPSNQAPPPSDGGQGALRAELYLMCDDVQSQIASLQKKNVRCSEVVEARWGVKTTILLPSGGQIGLYQPRHATAFNLAATRPKSRTSGKKIRSGKKSSPKKRPPVKKKR